MVTDEEIKANILLKLVKRKCWGGKHTSFENLKKGIKVQELGKEGLRRVDRLSKGLIKDGLILLKPTHYGLEVSLNLQLSRGIMEFVKRFYPEI